MPDTDIHIYLCQNNGMGNLTDTCHAIAFSFPEDDGFLFLEERYYKGIKILIKESEKEGTGGTIELYGQTISFKSSSSWAGNMAWNCYLVSAPAALAFINLLAVKREFSVSDGWTSIVSKYDNCIEITAEDLELSESIMPAIINPAQMVIEFNNEKTGTGQ